MWLPLLIMVLGFYCFFAAMLLVRMRLEVLKRESRTAWAKAEVKATGGEGTMSSNHSATSRHGPSRPLRLWSAYGIAPAGAGDQCRRAAAGPAPLPARRGASSAPGGPAVNPVRKKRLIIVLAIVAGVGAAVGLALSACNRTSTCSTPRPRSPTAKRRPTPAYAPAPGGKGFSATQRGFAERAFRGHRRRQGSDHRLPWHPSRPVPRGAGHRRPRQAGRRRRGGGR